MKVGLIGTGAISHKHAQVYRNIGFEISVCTNQNPESGKKFAAQYGCDFVPTYEELCRRPEVDFVDVCTFPDFRLQPLRICAELGKHIQVQKPISIDIATAREMVRVANDAKILLSVVSQHRFDDSSLFLEKAIADGRLGRLLQIDCYVKWYRSAEYYSRPIKGSWAVEGGGALINQAVHQIDILRWLAGPVKHVTGEWQLGALHKIESEDVLSALLRFESGVTGVVQASTAFWPGYSERVEIHGTKGTAVVTGDKLTAWDVQDDHGEPAPVATKVASGASDPMAISLAPFERQFMDFGDAIRNKRRPRVSGEEGLAALEIVDAIYQSCRSGSRVELKN
jgi:UDP-N-acetyl-2-amino-2-deoxyglucuronate dehydrogenase